MNVAGCRATLYRTYYVRKCL